MASALSLLVARERIFPRVARCTDGMVVFYRGYPMAGTPPKITPQYDFCRRNAGHVAGFLGNVRIGGAIDSPECGDGLLPCAPVVGMAGNGLSNGVHNGAP